MTCPAHDPKAPRYACWQRIPCITDRQDILLCQQCPYGRALMATVATMPEFVQQAVDVEAVTQQADLTKQEIIMSNKTYTMPELAELIGVDVKIVSNAKYSKGTPRPGSNIHLVIDKMDQAGITWDQVVPAPRGGNKKNRSAHVVGAAIADAAPSITPEAIGLPLVEKVCESSTLDIQDEDCSAEDLNDQDDGSCESVDRPIHLQDAIAAMRRHLPGATLTITIT